jgi:hypothetical protein
VLGPERSTRNATSADLGGRIDGHDPPQFLDGLPGRHGYWLLPVCCPVFQWDFDYPTLADFFKQGISIRENTGTTLPIQPLPSTASSRTTSPNDTRKHYIERVDPICAAGDAEIRGLGPPPRDTPLVFAAYIQKRQEIFKRDLALCSWGLYPTHAAATGRQLDPGSFSSVPPLGIASDVLSSSFASCCPFAARKGNLERRRPCGGHPPGR